MKTKRQGLAASLKGWRQLLGFCSIIASLPAMLVSHVLKARAEEAKKPEATVAGLTATLRERLNRNRTNLELLKRQSAFRLPHQKGNFIMADAFAGTDDCPGRPIPGGTYTAAVTMEYFGYLRRDPEDCHNSADPAQCGYIFHNQRFQFVADPDLLENIIVRGFIESPEYRHRFGP